MGRVSLPYLHTFKDRHGKLRAYVRRAGRRIAIHGEPGSAAFMEAYQAAVAELAPDQPTPPAIKPKPRTVGALIELYYRSPDWANLRDSTKRGARSVTEAIREDMGRFPVAGMRYEHVEKMMTKLADRPGAANNRLKRLRVLIRYAIRLGWIQADPTLGVKMYNSGEFHTWTADELEAFEKQWPAGSRERLAYMLHLYSGQRKQAVRLMAWSHISDGAIYVEQEKTGARVWIPIHPALAAELARWPRRHMLILTHSKGAGYTDGGYGNWFRDAIRAAGLPDRCSSHGLRKAAAARLAEAGCSTREIMAITGHKSLSEVERYTRGAEQKVLAIRAINRLGGKPENGGGKPDA